MCEVFIMQTMKAVRMHRYGGPEVLIYEEAPVPKPGTGEVLVRVHATAINPVDWKIREGHLREMLPLTLPLIPGWDVSGTVAALGGGVHRLAIGDEVFSRPDLSRDGAYAEYIVIRDNEVVRKPKSLDHLHAAAVPLAALTAWQALFVAAALDDGQKLLIHGAAGAVGSFAVQLAKWKGARIIATASTDNHPHLRALGADQVIDYRSLPFEEVVRDCDVVFDTIGGETQMRSWQTLKPGGILVSIVSPPDEQVAAAHRVRQAFVFMHPDNEQLAQIGAMIDAGKLKPTVGTILPLAEARQGQELSQSGHARGKIVLQVI